jgi:predicted RNA methylase
MRELATRLEHYETPAWAVEAILKREILTYRVVDPCLGIGILANAALDADYDVHTNDIHDWLTEKSDLKLDYISDYLDAPQDLRDKVNGATVLMNPPFSKAVQFVEKSFEYGARKIVCFQRFAWWESAERRAFWEKNPPNRVYICGNRANCWRHDIPEAERGSSSPTAHAWFVWERGNPSGTLMGHVFKNSGGLL